MSEQSFVSCGRHIRGGFVERLVAGLSASLAHAADAEQVGAQRGLLQGLDPRAKLLLCLALILSGVLTHLLACLAFLFALTLVLALASQITVARLATQVWAGVLLFTGLVALPALVLTPGDALWQLPLLHWTITAQGLRSALFLVGRAETSASACLLLVLTTPWPQVLKALRSLGVPVVVVAVLGMTQRYVFVLLDAALQLFEARRSRLLGPLSGAAQRRLVTATAGVLLEKSIQLSGEVHLAMIARGYRGEIHLLTPFRARLRDGFVAVLALLLPLLAWGIGQ